ncbi:hypothetical protein ACHAXR_002320 [Thalassiosira sp. AJA248-18]
MASSAPSTPRRRVSSVEVDNIDEPLGILPTSGHGDGNRSRLPSSEIPRTYSGLYGAGSPPIPDIVLDNSENDGGGGGSGGNPILSPPRVKSSLSPSNAPRARHGQHYYQAESNLLPFELSRNRNTDWIAAGGPALLATYICSILIILLTFLAFVTEPKMAWTMTNVAHGMVSMVYLHWIKGNPADYMDGTQGEMNAMTCWEQIVSKPAIHMHDTTSKTTTVHTNMESPGRGSLRESMTCAIKKLRSRDVLCVIPTLLAHASCHVAKYEFEYAMINVGVWAVVMLPKMPFMNGVRILGINRTAGIDDGEYNMEEEEDACFDTEEETSKESGVGLDFNDQLIEDNDESKKAR